MDILALEIVKQTNGKYAVWNLKEKSFYTHNRDSAEEIKDEILDRADRMLTDSILSYAGNDDWFQIRLAEYKIKHGLDTTEREQVISLLADMGESVEGR